MPIDLACACGRRLRVPDRLSGKFARCPACRALNSVPGPQKNGDGGAESGEEANDQQFVWSKTRLNFVPERRPERRPEPPAKNRELDSLELEPAVESCELEVVKQEPAVESDELEVVDPEPAAEGDDLEVVEQEEAAEGEDLEVVEPEPVEEDPELEVVEEKSPRRPAAKARPKLNDEEREERERPRKKKKKRMEYATAEDARGMQALYSTKSYMDFKVEEEERKRRRMFRGGMGEGFTMFGVHLSGGVITGTLMLITGLMFSALFAAGFSRGVIRSPRIIVGAVVYTIFGAAILFRAVFLGQED